MSATNATTTAQTTKDAFALAGGHVDAGAFEYRLHAADAAGAGENWYLRSTTTVAAAPPPPAPAPIVGAAAPEAPEAPVAAAPVAATREVPTFRAEVPLFAALPEQFRQANLAMLGSLHQRMGDSDASPQNAQRSAWGRVISTNLNIRQSGAVSPTSDGRQSGFQAGTDLFADTQWRAGVYAGQLDGGMQVSGFARGVSDLAVGSNDLRSRFLGGYFTWTHPSGFYADTVLQAGSHRYTVQPLGASAVRGKGDSLTASLELGQALALGANWKIEPQLQLVHRRVKLDDAGIAGAQVLQDTDNGWLLRAGVRVKGEFNTAAGRLQPYVRLNVYHAAGGEDMATFVGPAGSTGIASRTGGTSSELAGGLTLAVNDTVSLYGELGRQWASGGDTRVKSSIQGSLGVKVKW
ncbi:MAG: autotransporter outer membrane beta-barrel domain-containing protein [Variovorax sp.]